MGFEVFVNYWREGKPSPVAKAEVRALFPVKEMEWDSNSWNLEYGPADTCSVDLRICEQDKTQIEGFAVDRPCGDMRLWNALLQALRLGNGVLFWPGDEPPVVADPSVIAHLPEDMAASLGEPIYVKSAEEILFVLKSGDRGGRPN